MNVQKLSCHLMDKLSSHLLQFVSPRGSAPLSLMGNQAVLQAPEALPDPGCSAKETSSIDRNVTL